jgi:hypothetical protein
MALQIQQIYYRGKCLEQTIVVPSIFDICMSDLKFEGTPWLAKCRNFIRNWNFVVKCLWFFSVDHSNKQKKKTW